MSDDLSAAERITGRIAELGDWRGGTLATIRQLIHEALPDVEETWKWRGVPVWEDHGIICTGETYTDKVKLTFSKGAKLADPHRLFNASLEGNTRRAIDLHEEEMVNPGAFKALVAEAAALNRGARRK